jgi:hypothetical protein
VRLPQYIEEPPRRPATWRVVAAAVMALCASGDRDACGVDEVAALADLGRPGALRALHAAEARGVVRYLDGAWSPVSRADYRGGA